MNAQDFVYWLNGFFELSKDNNGLSSEQVEIIKAHIALVLTKVTGLKNLEIDKQNPFDLFKSPPLCGTAHLTC